MSRTAKSSTKLEDRLGADVLARLQSMAHEFGKLSANFVMLRGTPSHRGASHCAESLRWSHPSDGARAALFPIIVPVA